MSWIGTENRSCFKRLFLGKSVCNCMQRRLYISLCIAFVWLSRRCENSVQGILCTRDKSTQYEIENIAENIYSTVGNSSHISYIFVSMYIIFRGLSLRNVLDLPIAAGVVASGLILENVRRTCQLRVGVFLTVTFYYTYHNWMISNPFSLSRWAQ